MRELSDLRIVLFTAVCGGYALGALVSAFSGRRKGESPAGTPDRIPAAILLGYLFSALASLAGCALSLHLLLAPSQSGALLHIEILRSLPFGVISISFDELSAFFLGVISLLGFAVSIYSIGYCREYVGRRNLGLLGFAYNLLLVSLVLVIASAHAVLFLIAWELMSLATFILINFEHEDPAARRASLVYVIMTHAGTAFLIAMFLLLAGNAGSFDFGAMKEAGSRLPSPAATGVFLCAIVGFGVKAGIVPLHIWLPEAHPAAPSNVSAIMSGVMIKTGIYGLVRVLFTFLAPGPAWWGVLLLLIAVVSSVLGVLYALMEHDLKRLLAFHSIENIGIILMGVGAAVLFSSFGNTALAALALIAGIYHVLNHAIFKGLLFLGAGSVVQATHTKNIEELGGLVRKLPWTAGCFLVGSAAISALPPLNGFASEWLTFQALLLGFQLPQLVVRLAAPLTVALLALTGALAAACFVKAFGITFLGLPRSVRAEKARESSFPMIAAMGLLAACCVFFGVAPGLVMNLLDPVVGRLLDGRIALPPLHDAGSILLPQSGGGSTSPALLGALLLGLLSVPLVLGAVIGGKLRKRSANVWACGLESVSPRMQYTATGFSKPIRMIFSSIYRARHEVAISDEPALYFKPEIRYELKTESVFEKYLYEPLARAAIAGAMVVRRIQTGHIQSYLAYIFIVLILLLVFAR